MKRSILLILPLALIGLAGSALGQEALPDLKVRMKPMSFKSTKYPPHIENNSASYRLSPGDVATLEIEIANGGQAASGPFTLEVTLERYVHPTTERYKSFTKTYADLQPGARVTFAQDIQIQDPNGDIRSTARIVGMQKQNWSGEISESFGTILYWTEQFVRAFLKPDLTIALTSPESTRPLTRPVRLLVVVTNKGHKTSRATEITLRCKEKDVKKMHVPPLKPGDSFSHEFQHKWYTLGQKSCTARVDAEGAIDELDELNNQAEMTVYIK